MIYASLQAALLAAWTAKQRTGAILEPVAVRGGWVLERPVSLKNIDISGLTAAQLDGYCPDCGYLEQSCRCRNTRQNENFSEENI